MPKPWGGNKPHGLVNEYSGTMTNILIVRRDSYLPEMPYSVAVADYRFKDDSSMVSFVKYDSEDNRWPSEDEAWLLKLFDDVRRGNRGAFTDRQLNKTAIILFGVAFLVPLVILLRILKQKQT